MNTIEKTGQPENRKFELKRTLPSGPKWVKTIVAFANGAGGELILGVDDKSRDIVGIENPFELEEKISNTIHDSVRPSIFPYIQTINLKNRQILSVQILPGQQKPYYLASKGLEKGTYIRIGSTNRQADLSAIEELKRQAYGISCLDQIFFQWGKDALDNEALNTFFKRLLGVKKPLLNHFFHYVILRKNNGDIFPTFLGVVLFGKKDLPELRGFDYSKIKITRYKGIDRTEILSTQFFEPPLALKVGSIIDYTLSELPETQKLVGAKRQRIPLLPAFAVREAVINAIVHRDYSLKGASVQVDIFSDSCEITSPGVLPGTLSIDLLGQGISEIRNRSLARIFRGAGFMEELGSGISRMIQEMKNSGNPGPAFEEKGQYFCVTLRAKPQMTFHLEVLYQTLRSKGALSSSQISKKTNIHQNTAIKRLRELIDLEIIEKIGLGRNTKYRVKE
ncbi:MAG: putative DNA binding domain-containing protein [Desulfobacterales bacterium]|nr:putative DNA binding domain-containing protein [Desulfobacterales bacterium]